MKKGGVETLKGIIEFMKEMENIVVWVAKGGINKKLLFSIIDDLVNLCEISDITKQKYFVALSEGNVNS